ncbi:MAG: HEAT repeat domain-containing protein [Thermincola sp.]|nr:HEAT repeat domain-containing protein [Thermincola sp.]MDT3701962.1 HEAT repeat domain-containing protein [Thermincola sp.]
MADLLGMGILIIGIILVGGFFLMTRGSKRISSHSAGRVPDRTNALKLAAEVEAELTKLAAAGKLKAVDQVVDGLDAYPPEKQQVIRDFVIREGIVGRYQTGLGDMDYKVRAISAERLGKIGGSETAELLFRAMSDKNDEVRMSATAALKSLADPSIAKFLVEALKDPYKWLPARVAEVLVAIGPAGVPDLHQALESNDPALKGYIIEILGEIGEPSSASQINHILQDSNANIRLQAARSLGKIRHDSSIQPLAGLLEDQEVKVKVQAIRSLGLIGDSRAVQYLSPYLNAQDKVIKFAVSEALHNISDSNREAKVVIKYN